MGHREDTNHVDKFLQSIPTFRPSKYVYMYRSSTLIVNKEKEKGKKKEKEATSKLLPKKGGTFQNVTIALHAMTVAENNISNTVPLDRVFSDLSPTDVNESDRTPRE